MINFIDLFWKNFMSTGDQGTTLPLGGNLARLIIGANGAGKSTMLDALCFCLYGKPYREKLNKPQLVNSINKKKCLTYCNFKIGTKHYKVVRGIKPTKFEIHVDGVPLPDESDVRIMQDMLENHILKMGFKTFTQIVVLGTSNFTPFMEMPLGDRRFIIENLLDITIFSSMNDISKGRIKTLESDKLQLVVEFNEIEQAHSLKKDFFDKQSKDTGDRMDELEATKIRQEGLVAALTKAINIKKLEIDALKLPDLYNKWKEYQYTIDKLTNDLSAGRATIISNESAIKDNTDLITKKKEQIKDAEIDIKTHELALKDVIWKPEMSDEIATLQDSNIEDQKEIALMVSESSRYEAELQFYELNDLCDSCGRKITAKEKKDKISNAKKVMKANAAKKVTIQARIDERGKTIIGMCEQHDRHDKLTDDISVAQNNITSHRTLIRDMTEKNDDRKNKNIQKQESVDIWDAESVKAHIDQTKLKYEDVKDKHDGMAIDLNTMETNLNTESALLNSTTTDITNLNKKVDLEPLEAELTQLAIDITQQAQRIVDVNDKLDNELLAARTLKDDGIKTKIIRHYLPHINKYLNNFLDQFSFPVSFVFDEKFKETIKSRYRDEFSYASFSEGEKSRINLALMFTWRKIAMTKNRNATNILIFDEVFDSSMDGDGAEDFMKILDQFKAKGDIFVISHKEAMTGQVGFDATLEMYKYQQFSYMKEWQ